MKTHTGGCLGDRTPVGGVDSGPRRRAVTGSSSETRAERRDAEEKKSDCGKAAVSSGELGSSQNQTGQTGCLWKLRVSVRAGRQEDPDSDNG